jgi:hypothetical protein
MSWRVAPHPENSPESVYVPSRTTSALNQSDSLQAKAPWFHPIHRDPLCEHIAELVGDYLKPLLQDSCDWLEQDAIEVDGGLLVRGDVAEIWVGTMGDRKVAIKSYRPSFPCPDYVPIYEVSGAYLQYVPSSESLSAEVPRRSTGMQTPQGPAHRAIYRSVLHP